MKKSLVALAALAATGVFAQSSVTITGGVSMGFQQSTIRKDDNTVVAQMNRVGGADQVTGNSLYYTAVEDLGGGMKVTGVIQQRFGAGFGSSSAAPSDNQNAAITGSGIGDMYVQLDGSFGTIRAGRSTFTSNAGYNVFGVRSITALGVTAGATGLTSNGDNNVWYTTPSFSGLKVSLGLGLPGTKIGHEPAVGIKLNYDAGPLSVQAARTNSVNGSETRTATTLNNGLTYTTNGSPTAVSLAAYPATGKISVDTVAANYDFGVARVSAAFFRREAAAPVLPTAPKANGYSMGVAIPLGAATVKAGIMNNSKTDTLLDRQAIGVDYALSKRTTLIAEYARDKRALSGDHTSNNAFVGMSHTF